MDKLGVLLLYFVPFIFSLSFHEAAHAWMANRKGDPTARLMGRLTLNPAAHIDPIGTVLFPLISFFTGAPLIGWARPVPVNELNLKRWRVDSMWVAAAGPLSNLILALGFTGIVYLLNRVPASGAELNAGFRIAEPLAVMATVGIRFNLILAFFNLLPFPPLDGGRVAAGLFPQLGSQLAVLERYGFIVLYLLFFTRVLDYVVFMPAQILFHLLISLTA
ncbi:MAG TPA: site-2 protease family protein [Bdellovibrionota bacterium]|nr:site-2 protease family protein [Bdellovibrionota bacterium]